MKLRYLLDTNILSEPLRPQPHSTVTKKLLANADSIATATPVIFEIVQGAKRLPESKKRIEILQYLDEFIYPKVYILPYDTKAAYLHGEQQAQLILLGRKAPFIDGQIAAIAQVNQLVLVTRNVNDFTHFSGLDIENWFD
jgi:tRNA(fMet)-specific endonuclease VapC